MIFIFQYIGNNHPNWLSYFSEGLKPPTSCGLYVIFTMLHINCVSSSHEYQTVSLGDGEIPSRSRPVPTDWFFQRSFYMNHKLYLILLPPIESSVYIYRYNPIIYRKNPIHMYIYVQIESFTCMHADRQTQTYINTLLDWHTIGLNWWKHVGATVVVKCHTSSHTWISHRSHRSFQQSSMATGNLHDPFIDVFPSLNINDMKI